MSESAHKSAAETAHICCACFTHNGLPCCNGGHPKELTIAAAWRNGDVRAVKATQPTPPPCDLSTSPGKPASTGGAS